MKTVRVSTQDLPRPQEQKSTAPFSTQTSTTNQSFKRKQKTVKITEEVIAYYNNLLKEHNLFIQQNSSTTYRIL